MTLINRIDITISIEFKGLTIHMGSLKSPNHPQRISYDVISNGNKGTYEVEGNAEKYILNDFKQTETHKEALSIINEALK